MDPLRRCIHAEPIGPNREELITRKNHERAHRSPQVKRPKHNAVGRLTWFLSRVRVVNPAPLGKRRSRDQTDDAYLSAALAVKAECVVAYDKHLLTLEKPFGIEIVKPAEFLRRLPG